MPQLLGIRIRNFKALADVTLGKTGYGEGEALPAFACFIGPNGSGKSSLLDAFGFLADCLREGVESACDKPHRGGFERLRTQGSDEPIAFDLYFRQRRQSRPITYAFAVDLEEGAPVVVSELLRQRRKGQSHGRPFAFLRLEHGRGAVWSGESSEGMESSAKVEVALDDRTKLGITTLGNLNPYLVDALRPQEVWLIEKNEQGRVEVKRTDQIPSVTELAEEGIPLGSLWFSSHFHERGFSWCTSTCSSRVVAGILFAEFAADEGLDYVWNTIIDCGSLIFREYATCIAPLEGKTSARFGDLRRAADRYDVELDIMPDGDWNYCNSNYACLSGQGDCDTDTDCEGPRVCRHDVGPALWQFVIPVGRVRAWRAPLTLRQAAS